MQSLLIAFGEMQNAKTDSNTARYHRHLSYIFDFAHHDPEAISPELMLKNMEGVDESDRKLLYRMAEWMKERRG
jgi:hypothetical protein